MAAKVGCSDSTPDDQPERVGDAAYTSQLSSSLNKLRQANTLCDVSIIVADRQFFAHKAVLCTCSSYFMSMFASGFQESKRSEVTIEGSGESFAQLLEYAYTGYFHLSSTTVCGIFRMACYMNFTEAVSACVWYLLKSKESISLADSFEVYTLAQDHADLSALVPVFWLRQVQNFGKLTEAKRFLEHATKDDLLAYLNAEEIETDTSKEEEILQGAMNWLNHNWDQRKIHAVEILKKIRLGLVPGDNLKEIIGDEMLAIQECKEMVDDVLKLHATKETATVPLNRSHPDFFATRNTITAQVFMQLRDCDNRSFCRTKTGCYVLKQFAPLPIKIKKDSYEYSSDIEGSGFSSVISKGQLYVAGGYKEKTTIRRRRGRISDEVVKCEGDKKFFKYDLESNQWIVLPPLLKSHYSPGLVAIDDYIYAISGNSLDGEEENVYVERYDIANEQWELRHSMTFTLEGISGVTCTFDQIYAASYNEYVLILGERIAEDERCMVMYKPSDDSWTLIQKTDFAYIGDDAISRRLMTHEGVCYYAKSRYEYHSKGYNRALQVNKLVCNLERQTPSVKLGEKVDPEVVFGVDLEDTFKEPAQTLTFDKRKLGMTKLVCTHRHPSCLHPRVGDD